jgi:primosomal protein N'
MTEDLRHRGIAPQLAEQYALQEINDMLLENGLSCKDLKLPDVATLETMQKNQVLHPASQEEAKQLIASLNTEQRQFVDVVLNALETATTDANPSCQAYYLDGPGGSGKTRVYNTLIATAHGKGLQYK